MERTDDWFILSAKYGLTTPSTVLAPYDESLIGRSNEYRKSWASKTFDQLVASTVASDRIIFLAGKPYREHLAPLLNARGNSTAAPLSSLGIGSQVQWLQKLSTERQRLRDIDRLYEMLGKV